MKPTTKAFNEGDSVRVELRDSRSLTGEIWDIDASGFVLRDVCEPEDEAEWVFIPWASVLYLVVPLVEENDAK
jgi:hypothetical protein